MDLDVRDFFSVVRAACCICYGRCKVFLKKFDVGHARMFAQEESDLRGAKVVVERLVFADEDVVIGCVLSHEALVVAAEADGDWFCDANEVLFVVWGITGRFDEVECMERSEWDSDVAIVGGDGGYVW